MTFKDLKFKEITGFGAINRARAEFPNGNGLSVVSGSFTYSDGGAFEIGPLHNGNLFFIENWGDTVLGYVRPSIIDEILKHAENDSHEDYKKFLNNLER